MALSTREVIDGIFADAATGDLERVLRWWHDEGTLEDVTIGQAFVGKQALREYLDMYYRALPTVTYEPIRLMVSGPTAMVEWMQPARISGSFDGVPADGREVLLHAMDVFHVVDGLIVHEVSWYGDGWFRQRLEGVEGLPPALPLTPRLAAGGDRFGANGADWKVT